MFTDTHTHLFYENYSSDLDEVIQRAFDSGVKYMIVPGTNIPTSEKALELASRFEGIYAAVGIHPHDTSAVTPAEISKIASLAKNPKVVAIGEIGLDYYYDFSPKDKQAEILSSQIDIALELNKPVIIHNREADEDIMNIMRKYNRSGLKAQFHCFSGSIEMARELIEMHHYISFTGNITFNKLDSIREVVKRISTENLLLETDSPFMTPIPHRGKRNEPAYIRLVAEKIAEIHKLTVEDVARTTSYNAFRLYGIGEKPKLHYTYKIGTALYINVTNRCNADCIFCSRKTDPVISGYNLAMTKSQEPDAGVYINEIGNPADYSEIVFCGYGEPTIRWDVVKEVASYVKSNGGNTRLNSDGHGNVINKKDITPELAGLIDLVSISLNSTDPDEYARIMRVSPEMHSEMIKFAKSAMNYTRVVMSVVGMSEIDTKASEKFVTENIGCEFRVRELF